LGKMQHERLREEHQRNANQRCIVQEPNQIKKTIQQVKNETKQVYLEINRNEIK
jgi:hypothetical protein